MHSKTNKIPVYVSNWADKYFHQSAFETPINFPGKKIVAFLQKFKKEGKVKLYRGVHKYNKENYIGVQSWSYDKNIALRYIKECGGKIIEKTFKKEKILLDTTLLNKDQKILLGYNFGIDDKEILVII